MYSNRFDFDAFSQRLDALTADNQLGSTDSAFRETGDELFAEPTTIELIVEIGGLIVDALGLLDNSPKFGEWLERISDQLGRFEGFLKDILNRLERLEVIIRGTEIEDAETELLAGTDIFVDNVREWRARPTAPENLADMRAALRQIQTGVREVIRYGSATYNTVGYTLAFETDLLYMTGKSVTSKQDSFTRYTNYFNECLDEGRSGSVTNVRRNAEAVASSLSSQFPPRSNFRERLGRASWAIRPLCERSGDVIMVINGSLEGGFSGEIITENETTECDPRGRLDAFFVTRSENFATDRRDQALQPFRIRLQETLTSLNAAGEQFRNARGQAAILREAEQRITMFRDTSQRLFRLAR